MIGYVTVGTNDIERAAQFYDQLLSELGAKRFMDTETYFRDPDGNKLNAFYMG